MVAELPSACTTVVGSPLQMKASPAGGAAAADGAVTARAETASRPAGRRRMGRFLSVDRRASGVNHRAARMTAGPESSVSALEGAAEERDGLRKGRVGDLGVEAIADVATKGVLGVVLAPREAGAQRRKPGADGLARRLGRVRVARAPDREQLALDLAGAGE